MNETEKDPQTDTFYTGIIAKLRDILQFNPRAAKLMAKKKPFIVVAHDEYYFSVVYGLIRNAEMDKNTWSAEDEEAYRKLTGRDE